MSAAALESIHPLSALQQGLLFHGLYARDDPAYFVQACLTLRGELDAERLHEAWQALVDHHDMLRTLFVWRGRERPLQVVQRSVTLPWEALDWSAATAAECDQRLPGWLREDRQRGFYLDRAPLLRVALLRLGAGLHLCRVSFHHLVLDGWSFAQLLDELRSGYSALSRGQQLTWPEARPYRDYVGWLNARDPGADLAFWREQLRGFGAATPLPGDAAPLDGALAAAEALERLEWTAALAPEIGAALHALARRERVTFGCLMQGAWALLLARCSGQAEVCFGLVVSTRPSEPGFERSLGLFLNTLPLRVDLDMGLPFAAWLRALQQQQAALLDHRHLALSEIHGASAVPRGESLFESIVVIENYPRAAPPADGETLQVELGAIFDQTHYPLTLVVVPGPPVTLLLRADRHRFAASGAEVFGALQALLADIARDADRPLAALSLLTPPQRRQQLVDWNATRQPFERGVTLHELVRRQVLRDADAPALEFEGRQLAYGELLRRSRRLAWRLRALGVGSEARVGLCMERSLALPVALLAVLEAGAAYVALEPQTPPQRLRHMLQDAAVQLVLAEGEAAQAAAAAQRALAPAPRWLWLAPAADGGPGGELVHDIAADGDPGPALPAVDARQLAYVLYTSGSTGRPKGVMVTHEAIVNRLQWMQQAYGLQPGQRVLHKTPIGFDVSVWELFWPLLQGALMVLARPGGHRDSAYLVQLIAQRRITHVHFVPSMLAPFLAEPQVQRCAGVLQALYSSGEALSAQLGQRCRSLLGVELHNLYGPTEAAVDVTAWRCGELPGQGGEPIGRPIANVQTHVLDAQMQLLPVGVAGELYLGGVALARGYQGQPALSAERFVPDPWGTTAGGRLYRTGDRVRWREDGVLEYLGRLDGQLKIRGQRVEPAEVEAVLLEQPAVQQAAVIGHELAPGHARLLAYLVVGAGFEGVAALQQRLRQRLPEAMRPAQVELLAALPLTASGKLDRRRLPAPAANAAGRRRAPRSHAEQALARIWCELMRLDEVGLDDDFFELGGDSLLAMQVVARLRSGFGVELPLRVLFDSPRLVEVAARLQALRLEAAGAAPAIARGRAGLRAPLSWAQQRLWFDSQWEPEAAVHHIAQAFLVEGPLDAGALELAWHRVASVQHSLRTVVPSADGEAWQQVVDAAPPLLQQVLDTGGDERTRVSDWLAEQVRQPFDLQRGPLARLQLAHLGPDRHVLLVCLHHLIADGWSLAVLARQLGEAYRGAVEGSEAWLPEPGVQYVDHAHRQRTQDPASAMAGALAYWQQQLRDAPARLLLPADLRRGPLRRQHGASLQFGIAPPLANALRALAARQHCTSFMLLLAAFQTLLHLCSGQRVVVVGTPVANRGAIEVEELIGLFVNTLPLCTAFETRDDFRTLLGRVRETVLQGLAHQQLPFDLLVEHLRPLRDPASTPIFQAMFVYEAAPAPAMPRLIGSRLRPLAIERRSASHDLTLAIADDGRGLGASLEYATDAISAAAAQRLANRLQRLLEAVVADPSMPLRQLPLLLDGERETLLRWGDGGPALPPAALHELVREQARRRPAALALQCAEQRLSYGGLEAAAAALAAWLRRQGAGPEVRIAVCLPRGLDFVISLLAVLAAGAAYVPLDPNDPPARRAQIVRQSGARGLLTTRRLPPPGEHIGCPLWLLEDIDAAAVDAAPAPAVDPRQLACVVFTSGSTGSAKGVMVSHASMANYLRACALRFGLGEADRVLQFSSLAFDASAEEIFAPLLSGAAVVMRDDGWVGSSAGFWQRCHGFGITVLDLPTAYFHVLVEDGIDADWAPPPTLRLLVIGGETARPDHVVRWARQAPRVSMINSYGPTEATICATLASVDADADLARRDRVAVGRPVAGVRALVLDEALRLAPTSVVGELFLAGAGLARGYSGSAGATAARFLPDPHNAEGGRLYRSGDLARWRDDGQLEILGRVDRQLKIRGYRVDPAEVEQLLRRDPAVRDAAVTVQVDAAGMPRLVAYVVGAPGRAVDTAALLRRCARELPEPMLPQAVLAIERMPLTPRGKRDLSALTLPADWAQGLMPAARAPRTPTEQVVAALWCQLLGVERIGIEQDFFAAGGHSLLATRLLSRLRSTFGVELPLQRLFLAPTIEAIAAAIDELRQRGSPGHAPWLPAGRPKQPPRATPAQQTLWRIAAAYPGLGLFNLPLAVRLEGRLDIAALRSALLQWVQRHDALRMRFREAAGALELVVDPAPAEFLLPTVAVGDGDLQQRRAAAAQVVTEEALLPFELRDEPGFRSALLVLDEREHWLLLTFHHIVVDDWSLGLLFAELAAGYAAALAQPAPPRAPAGPQFAEVAAALNAWIDSSAARLQQAYWRQRLAPPWPLLRLAEEPNAPRLPLPLYGVVHHVLRAEACVAMSRLARHEGATPFMAYLALLKLLLARRGGQGDVRVATLVANRHEPQLEQVVGLLLNTVVLRTDLADGPSLRVALQRVRQTCLQAYAHAELPFEQLLPALEAAGQPMQALCQVMFLYRAAAGPLPALPGLTVHGADEAPAAAGLRPLASAFELILELVESAADDAGHELSLRYDAQRFQPRQAAQWLQSLDELLVACVAEPDDAVELQ